ncbi:hypothetical protein J6590_068085 [Homalodisca vitripennis]|nr:hypothetical protein J6590_068085 [Homalodisca vitripennis]
MLTSQPDLGFTKSTSQPDLGFTESVGECFTILCVAMDTTPAYSIVSALAGAGMMTLQTVEWKIPNTRSNLEGH